jgi:hypothetical protein
MTVSTGPIDHAKVTGARWLAGAAAALTLLGLYAIDWWPSGFPDPSFMEFREDYVAGLADDTTPWWNVFHDSWFRFGFLFQTFAVLLLPFTVGLRGRAHWLSALAVLGAVWQLVGVLGSTIFNITFAPFMGPIAGLLALAAWGRARSGLRG